MGKYRVHELAKELDISSHDLLDMLQDLGIEAKSHMCAISEADALEILALADDGDAKKAKPKKAAEVKKEEVEEKAPDKAVKTDKKKKKAVEEEAEKEGVEVVMPITVNGFAQLFNKSANEVIVKLMGLGVMANLNQELDEETVELLADAFNLKMHISEEETVHEEEEGIDNHEDRPEQLKSRPPVITVMGHVDHGKTSLLDRIRSSGVADTEAGGITQHIGASEVFVGQNKIVFLDTPGHEAFTSMRARGAQITDIAILVVAADDGVKPQTIEAINHAKSADVPIIVAVNKMDKPEANPMRVYQELSEHGILVEEWGGDTISAAVSAKTGEGIENLLDMILLQAEVLELKANPSRFAKGTVVESKLDKAKGPVATIIVQNGSMSVGDSIVVGATYGRVRAMTNSHGAHIKKAGPSTAVEILGLDSVPLAGDQVDKVKDDKTAKSISDKRSARIRHESMKSSKPISLDDVFNKMKEGQLKDLNIILKADVQGSVGAIEQSLAKISNEEVNVRVIHSGVGTITESDILLAQSANAIIIGFNVRPSTTVTNSADEANVDIRTYRIIYEAIDDIEQAMKGMLDPEYREVILGKVEIRETFKVPNVGTIGGAYVIEGKVTRNAEARLVRDGIVLFEGKISSLKRFKDDVKEVASGYECGIGLEKYNDIKEGDIVEAYTMEEIPR